MTSELVGTRELKIKLDHLKKAASGKALKSATLSAMLPAYRAAQQSAPRGTVPHVVGRQKGRPGSGTMVRSGYASRSVRRRTIKKWNTHVRVAVGVTSKAFYAVNFIELGWRPGKRSKSVKDYSRRHTMLSDETHDALGDSRSKIPGRPWLEPSMRNNQAQVQRLFEKRLEQVIKAQVKKGNSRRFGRRL